MNEGADFRDIDVDWRANVFDKCRLVHDDDMQTLWANILAGEANNPGTYSKHSVNFVGDMEKTDAQLFTDLCRYVCEIKYTTEGIEKIELVPLIFNDYLLPTRSSFLSNTPIYHIRTPDLHHLDNIGLIRLAEPQPDKPDDVIDSEEPIEVNYYGESICLSQYSVNSQWTSSSSREDRPPIGRVKLTQIGKELYPICGSTPVEGFFNHICHWDWLPYIMGLDDEAKVREFRRTYKRTWCKHSIE